MSNRSNNFGHPSGMYWYDTGMKLVYVPCPKNASTTIRGSLGLGSNVGYMFENTIDLTGYRKFCVVRNPFTRLISGYSEVLKVRRDGGYKITESLPFWGIDHDPLVRFEQFVKDISRVGFYDAHIQPQKYYLADYPIDKKIRFENLANELDEWLRSIGINRRITHRHNTGWNDKCMYLNHIVNTPWLKEVITELYSEDFEL